ncbi:hypothetical protein TrRE_jg13065 [Triparma retinervis]|uniref:Nickel/cobalt efflux system n=1 Tax=Triparma retinervis TaxID=2557542 RepID=A0A9W7GA08_9STRA|nr:hypothetical protein TrRE_jg13065 [Triparma retinervis]
MGQRWYKSIRVGAIWGLGHGLSAMLLGASAYGLKSAVSKAPAVQGHLQRLAFLADFAVGISLVIIGAMGIREAREWGAANGVSGGSGLVVSPSSLGTQPAVGGASHALGNRAVLLNGILHGFSWDGAPSLAGGLAVKTWRGNAAFLVAYALGTVLAMSATTTVIGEGTVRIGERMKRPDVPVKLSFWSSVVAVVVGVAWIGMGMK